MRLLKLNINPKPIMAKALTKSQIASEIAEKNGIAKKQAVEILEHLAALAYKHATDSFTIPGLGKLVLVTLSTSRCLRPMSPEF
jgi:DNA-binding protein HU-beta